MIADFEIIPGKEFLNRFLDKRDMFLLSPAMVEKLRASNDPYGKYGYGRWLYATGSKDKDTLCTVRDCVEFAVESNLPDALFLLSRLYYNGHYIDKESGIMKLDRKRGEELLKKAKNKGSEIAKLQISDDEFITARRLKKSVAYIIKKTKKIAETPGVSLLWKEQLAWMYDMMDRTDEAIALYEECVAGGLQHPLFFLALLYYNRGNVAYYESLMEDGIEKGVPSCFMLGFEELDNWEEYDEKTREKLHKRLDANLRRGSALGCTFCTYTLTEYLRKGLMGFEMNDAEALRYARRGMDMGIAKCFDIALDIFFFYSNILPAEMNMTKEEVLMARLKAVRNASIVDADNILCSHVLEFTKELKKLGYAEELEYWRNLYAIPADRFYRYEEEDDDDDECVNPMVLVIHPSGLTEFVDTESKVVSYTSLIELIDAEGCDAVHYSDVLSKITKDCGLKKNLAFYVDKNGIAKDLPDNAIGTMLYGHGYEIRGAIVVALEDKKYNTCAFVTEEDIEAVYDAINEYTGLLRRSDEQDDDGRYDAWA